MDTHISGHLMNRGHILQTFIRYYQSCGDIIPGILKASMWGRIVVIIFNFWPCY